MSLDFVKTCRRMRYKQHFCSEVSETFSDLVEPSQSNLATEEWEALRNLASDRSIVIKGHKADYVLEAEKHLNDKQIYK